MKPDDRLAQIQRNNRILSVVAFAAIVGLTVLYVLGSAL
uniref:Uncharacterized protein n=1 Tax=blood disease bacterium R229 TaxID=741978 RepID=G2ZK35_9RALS|nr:hypothetical protein BDB_60005 [blood disease bacterium R229]